MNLSHDAVRDLAAGFVLGALTPEEAAAVRDHLATCAEPHPEIEELGGVVPYLAEAVDPVEPPAALRARILAAAAAEGSPARAVVAAEAAEPAAPPASITFPGPEGRAERAGQGGAPAIERAAPAIERAPSAAGRASRLGTWAMGIAAVLAIAVLGAWNLQLQARLSDVEGSLAAATAYQQGVARVLEVATQEGAQTALLVPADPTTAATGIAAAGPDGTVVISMRDLAPTAGTQVYEAWVIVGEDAPVPLGGFTVGAAGTGSFSGSTAAVEPGAILALTLEPGPNATTPTKPVLSIGSLAASG